MSARDELVVCDPAMATRYLLHWGWRRPLGEGQFRLASLFVMLALVAGALAAWQHWQDRVAPGRALRQLGASVQFRDHERIVLVDLSGCEVTDEHLRLLRHMPQEMELDLSGVTLTDAAIDHLIRIPHLVHVDLTGTGLRDSSLQRFLLAKHYAVTIGPIPRRRPRLND